ncbi:MAG: hypothetical protein ACI9VI_003095 [Candidatus Azotimanducaceae bacterium]|jgi:hypothetical protein
MFLIIDIHTKISLYTVDLVELPHGHPTPDIYFQQTRRRLRFFFIPLSFGRSAWYLIDKREQTDQTDQTYSFSAKQIKKIRNKPPINVNSIIHDIQSGKIEEYLEPYLPWKITKKLLLALLIIFGFINWGVFTLANTVAKKFNAPIYDKRNYSA